MLPNITENKFKKLLTELREKYVPDYDTDDEGASMLSISEKCKEMNYEYFSKINLQVIKTTLTHFLY